MPAADLPVREVLDLLRDALRTRRRAVLVAPPGAGKTTVVPLALLEEPWLGDRRVVMLEPRRLAARAAARRMAATLGEPVGETVGFQTRDERRISARTRIEVITEGILTRRIQSDPELPGTGLVIFDEVHERNLPTDLGLAFVMDVVSTLRGDLRVLAMSATADTVRLPEVLGGDEGPAPVITSEAQQHPVTIRWLPRHARDRLEPAVVSAVQRALAEQDGDVLVFLPGIGEIMRTLAQLRDQVADHVDLRPLAGTLTATDQDLALTPSEDGRRRVVLATDIAETSLTVEGVRAVVDSGLARAPRFDRGTGMTRLATVSISRSSADQRAGRSGRQGPGICYRLWSQIEHGSRRRDRTPEIAEVDLAGLALELAAWGTDPARLAFIDPPPAGAMRTARDLLESLGAMDPIGATTELGRAMIGLPVHPRLAAMMVRRPEALTCAIAALVDERDLLRGRSDDLPSDLTFRLELLVSGPGADPRGFDRRMVDERAIHRVRERARDLARRLGCRFDLDQIDTEAAGAALLHAFPDRIAARRRPGQFQLFGGHGAWLPEEDPLAHEPFVIAIDLDGRRTRSRIRLAAAVAADEVAEAFADQLGEQRTLEWDTARDDLVERVERRLGGIRLDTITRPPPEDQRTRDALMARIRSTGLAQLGWSTAAIRLRERVAFAHRTLGEPWPDWGVETLIATLADWLGPYLSGATGRTDLEALDLVTVLRAQLPWEVGAELDTLIADSLALPTGRSVPIDYGGEQPMAAVRVQDLFGVTEHPTVAGQPIVLHLLSPADRPLQITADLPGFWAGSWAQVRREMAGRYPKHRWPEDPTVEPPRRLRDP